MDRVPSKGKDEVVGTEQETQTALRAVREIMDKSNIKFVYTPTAIKHRPVLVADRLLTSPIKIVDGKHVHVEKPPRRAKRQPAKKVKD
jgi:hypothetical protein